MAPRYEIGWNISQVMIRGQRLPAISSGITQKKPNAPTAHIRFESVTLPLNTLAKHSVRRAAFEPLGPHTRHEQTGEST